MFIAIFPKSSDRSNSCIIAFSNVKARYYSAMVPAFEKLFDSQDNKLLFGEYLRNLSILKQRVQEYQALGYHDPELNHLSGAEQKLLGMIGMILRSP